MTTSSFDRNRCTRISPSAVLDDRLDGKDLEWARDHLRRCEACRERVEDFREMLLRVGRLPSASVSAAAMDQAYAVSVPDRLRGQGRGRSFEIGPSEPTPGVAPLAELPTPMRPEVTSAPDLLSELEREIFGDQPAMDHPMPLTSSPDSVRPALENPAGEDPADMDTEPMAAAPEVEPVSPAPEADPAIYEPRPWREVQVDSHRELEPRSWETGREIAATPEPEPLLAIPEPEVVKAAPEPEPVAAWPEPEPATAAPEAEPEPQTWQYEPEPAREAPVPVTSAAPKPDTAMRIAVGLGAAACVLLAAVLYEGGWLSKGIARLSATRTAATASIRPTAHPSATVRASLSPSIAPTAPPAPVLFTLGNGVSGDSVFRIRPGTAVAGYTRLVFDMHGAGLPTMVVSRPDDLHVGVTFKNTGVTGVPVNGIRSYQVAGIEPPVQQGPDGTITIDLARPVRVTAFTLAATGSYAWRLVVDLHTS